MTVRKLQLSDKHHLYDIVNSKGTVTNISPTAVSIATVLEYSVQYRQRWVEGMEKYYLVNNETHDLYGYFDKDILVSCMGWRSDLPDPWYNSWVVGNLKARPGYSIRTNGMIQLWQTMFEVCEAKGLTSWHMLIPESNKRRYQVVADKYFKEIDSSYDYEWSYIVPPNVIPDVDWVWGSMGRQKLNAEIRVRTGTKKCVTI
jgi:hypothetical protein